MSRDVHYNVGPRRLNPSSLSQQHSSNVSRDREASHVKCGGLFQVSEDHDFWMQGGDRFVNTSRLLPYPRPLLVTFPPLCPFGVEGVEQGLARSKVGASYPGSTKRFACERVALCVLF